jgi:hypothetical protein
MTFKFISGHPFRKWDLLKASSEGNESIVIRVEKKEGMISTTMFPYEKQDTKLGQFIWWKLLKLFVFFKII